MITIITWEVASNFSVILDKCNEMCGEMWASGSQCTKRHKKSILNVF